MMMKQSEQKREQAARLLTHYIELVMERAGLRHNVDTAAEIRECVDCIVDAAILEVQGQ